MRRDVGTHGKFCRSNSTAPSDLDPMNRTSRISIAECGAALARRASFAEARAALMAVTWWSKSDCRGRSFHSSIPSWTSSSHQRVGSC
jgi:hypothetical protein